MGKNIPTSDFSIVRFPKQADRFKTLRVKHDMTQDDLCKLVGRDLKTYRKWEKGIERPDCEILILLAKKYSVSTDYLLGLIDEKNHDLKFVCEYTGLSENAISDLNAGRFDKDELALISLLINFPYATDTDLLLTNCINFISAKKNSYLYYCDRWGVWSDEEYIDRLKYTISTRFIDMLTTLKKEIK